MHNGINYIILINFIILRKQESRKILDFLILSRGKA